MSLTTLLPRVGMALGALLGLYAIGNIPDAAQTGPSDQNPKDRRHTNDHPQHHQRDSQKESYARKESRPQHQKPQPKQEANKGFLLEQAKELSNSGDLVMIEQMIAEMEDRIDRGKEVGANVKDAQDARSLLLGKLKSLPQANATAAQEAQELRVRMGEMMA